MNGTPGNDLLIGTPRSDTIDGFGVERGRGGCKSPGGKAGRDGEAEGFHETSPGLF